MSRPPVLPEVLGVDLDGQTRCKHWHSPLDVIAIKMHCCSDYYACKDCHAELAGHPATVWPQGRWSEKAVLCGVCNYELTIAEYLASGYECPNCRAAFNPGCRKHYEFYFEPIF